MGHRGAPDGYQDHDYPLASGMRFKGEAVHDHDRYGKPFQLDRYYALETHSETVRRYYPRWYRSSKTG